MIRTARNVVRLTSICWTLARYDALQPLSELQLVPGLRLLLRLVPRRRTGGRLGERIANALEELGPAFIKFGQSLSTRSDLIGETVAEDLGRLRDRLPPFPPEKARATIEAELGKPVAALFAAFEDTPIAAASIAQVHFATTTEGEQVAVKVLRPDVEAAFTRDIDLFLWIAEIVERVHPAWRRLKPVETVKIFAATVRDEMDLRFEAAAASELAENFADDPDFRVPTIDWRRTGRRVLTTERVSGIPIHQRQTLIDAGHDPRALIGRAAAVIFNQVFRDGFFHADLHPGNLFVAEDGALIAVDFGIMGRLDKETRRYLAEMLVGFLTSDYAYVAEVHFRAGYVPPTESKAAFAQACRSIGEPILGLPANEISFGRLIAQLFQVTEAFHMETQPHLLLLQKTMMVAEGVSRNLDPTINMWQLAQPLMERWVADILSPQTRVRDATHEIVDALQRLPQVVDNLDKAARSLARGNVQINVQNVDADIDALPRQPTNVLLAGIAAILILILLLQL